MNNASLGDLGTPASAPVAPIAEAPQEKLLPQSEVNALVGRVKQEAAQKAYHQGKLDAAQELSVNNPTTQPTQTQGNSTVNVDKLVDDKLRERDTLAQGQQIANQFASKMIEGGKEIPDFENKMKDVQWDKIPDIIHLVTVGTDNTAKVMADLVENPEKMANLRTLLAMGGNHALNAVKKLSASIKANDSADNNPIAPEPLSQIKTSATTGADNGTTRTVSDFKKAPYLRA
jgi:hypothetical protein